MMGSFLKKLFFLSQNGQFFQIFESSLEVQRVKEKFSNNPGHNILELFNNLVQVQIATSKTKLGLQYNKLGTRVVSRVAESLRTQDLRKLGNIQKMSNVGGDIAQCSVLFAEIKVEPQQSKNTQYYISNFSSLVQFYCISLLYAKYFVLNCVSKQIFSPTLPQFFSNLNFWEFSVTLNHFSNNNKNIKQVSCVKVPNLMVLCKQYFVYLIWLKFGFRKLST